MNKNKVLVVEDESPIRNFISKVIVNNGYEVAVATNGAEALEMYMNDSFPVIITDLNMPVMRGDEFIDKINSMNESSPPTIIVLTSEDDIKKAIEIIKRGIFDYQIKPANANELSIKVRNAFKVFELNKIQYALEKEKEIRLNEQLAWFKYKAELKEKDPDKYRNNLIYNMKHNFGQAGGFGSIVTLVKLISMSAEEDGENYIISKEIIDLIKENANILETTLETIEKISSIAENPINLNRINILDFYNMLERIIENNKSYLLVSPNELFLSEKKSTFSSIYINIDRDQISEAIEEGIRNACKFSEKNSKIFVIVKNDNENLSISILNEPTSQTEIRGIPIEYSNLVFEPFYRISKFVDERFKTLDIGFGLSLVKAIIKKHGGSVTISNIKDFTAVNAKSLKVNLELLIPISEK